MGGSEEPGPGSLAGQHLAHAIAVAIAIVVLLWAATGWTVGFTIFYLLFLWMLFGGRRTPKS